MPLVLAAMALMAGCAATSRTGADLETLNKTVGAPKAGRARVFVLREPGYGGIGDTGWEIHVDGAPIGALKTGTFVYRDLPAGRRQLSFAPPGHLARASHYELAAVPGRTYYFRLEMNDKGKMINAGAALGGLSGYFLASAIADGSDERGVYDFIPMEDAAARTAMAELRLAE